MSTFCGGRDYDVEPMIGDEDEALSIAPPPPLIRATRSLNYWNLGDESDDDDEESLFTWPSDSTIAPLILVRQTGYINDES